jgi:hypothetical protein
VTIDGFPVDCGTQRGKFLSMSKCIAVTTMKHPHIEVVEDVIIEDSSDSEYVDSSDDEDEQGRKATATALGGGAIDSTSSEHHNHHHHNHHHHHHHHKHRHSFGILGTLFSKVKHAFKHGNKKPKQVVKVHYVQPFELWRDMGKHIVESGPLVEFLPSYFTTKGEDILMQYGVGISLYFKFLKTFGILLTIVALFAIIPMSYYSSTR